MRLKTLSQDGFRNVDFFYGIADPSVSGRPHYRGFTITLMHIYTRQDSSRQVISPTQRPLPNTQQSQESDIHATGGIRTQNSIKREAVNPRLRPRIR
jgi:hypothetical protein